MVAERIERILARKKCKPTIVNNTGESLTENRRKFFIIKLPLSLEAVLEVLEVKGNQIKIRKNIMFSEGSFISVSDYAYFK